MLPHPIVKPITEWDFIKAFRNKGLIGEWSLRGMRALYRYLCDTATNIGEPIILDVEALASDFKEYSDIEELEKDLGVTVMEAKNKGWIVSENPLIALK